MLTLRALPLLLLTLASSGPATTREAPRAAGEERVRVDLVPLDVVVRDQKDRPVSGLARDDLEVQVGGQRVEPAEIESFEEVCPAASSALAGKPPVTSPLRHIVIYLDFSQMTLRGRQQALKAARDFLAGGLDPSDRVMIVAHKSGLRLLHEFTSDGPSLIARLDGLLDDTSTIDTDVLEESQKVDNVARRTRDPVRAATAYAQEEEQRALRSLRALEALIPTLAGLRGRKALVLFTDVLREEPGIEYLLVARTSPQAAGINLNDDVGRLTREANAAGVSIYTVHASGPKGQPVRSSEGVPGVRTAAEAAEDSALALQATLAATTGGRALRRAGDPAAVLRAARQDLSCYYLLGYRHAGHGDNRRLALKVRVKSDPAGKLIVRHRAYVTDEAIQDRRDRLASHALATPVLYRALPVTAEAFALAPEKQGRRVLIKATVPLAALSMAPLDAVSLEGRAMVRGEVSRDGRAVHGFGQDVVTLKISQARKDTASLVYETGCVLKPGTYTLTVAVMDRKTSEIGTGQATVTVPTADIQSQPYLGDVHLWARDPEALIVAVGTEKIGLKPMAGASAFIPRAERRIARNQEAYLSFLVCPPTGSIASPESPIQVRQMLANDQGDEVAGFRDLSITDPPDSGTGCYQVSSGIPPGKLRSGIYSFTIQVAGDNFGSPISRRAALAVD